MGREVGRQAAHGSLIDQRRAEVVEVVEVDDVRAQAVERRGERRCDRGIIELAERVAEVEEPVVAVVDADQPDVVLFPLDDLVGDLADRSA